MISAENAADFAASLATAHELWPAQASWSARFLDCAAQELLSIYNVSWLDDDQAPLNAAEFQSKMCLNSISVNGGSFSFMYGDSDMFCGHSIVVNGRLSDGVLSAELFG